ncbi:hypothetical protein VIGAN_05275600 [Vigna angularis var. angularis]|uniref:NB-ARC domain-containing protein n=1 Tax=Vigna angularis var. angularis TaxID=157739 RepID=A0A0S3S887_PHAAN|nr:hypothetical protein VIGAN_05275600 [Vigna angularis var. angularis]
MKIKAKIKEIFDNNLEAKEGGGEEDVVGFAVNSKVVIEKLMVSNSHLKVVSVIAMSGLKKTTLARKRLKDHAQDDLRNRKTFICSLQAEVAVEDIGDECAYHSLSL